MVDSQMFSTNSSFPERKAWFGDTSYLRSLARMPSNTRNWCTSLMAEIGRAREKLGELVAVENPDNHAGTPQGRDQHRVSNPE